MLTLILSLLACSPPGSSADDSAAPAPTDDSAPVAEADLPDPAWNAEEVGSLIRQPLNEGLPDPTSLLASFEGMFVGADPDCPTMEGDFSMTLMVSYCLSDTGYLFAGVSGLEADDEVLTDFWLMGDCYITDADGLTYTCAGELERVTTDDGWELKMTGIWGYEASPTPWIARVPSMALWETRDADGVHINGSYGTGETYMYFDEVTVVDDCPTGAVWLRDPQGAWYVLSFSDACDGCGEVTYGDETLGEACVNMAPAANALAVRME